MGEVNSYLSCKCCLHEEVTWGHEQCADLQGSSILEKYYLKVEWEHSDAPQQQCCVAVSSHERLAGVVLVSNIIWKA